MEIRLSRHFLIVSRSIDIPIFEIRNPETSIIETGFDRLEKNNAIIARNTDASLSEQVKAFANIFVTALKWSSSR